MARIQLQDGRILEMDKENPTPAEIDEVVSLATNQSGYSVPSSTSVPPAGYSRSGVPYYDPIALEQAKANIRSQTPSANYTEGAAQKISQAEAMKSDLAELRAIIQRDQKEYKQGKNMGGLASAQFLGMKPQVYFSSKGQDYRLIRESLSNRLLYLRSGAQINEKEYKRLSNLLSQWWRSDKLDLTQLDRLEEEFVGIADKIRYGRKGDMQSQPVSTPATNSGFRVIGSRDK